MAQQRQDRRGEVQAATASATGLACFIFRFLRRPPDRDKIIERVACEDERHVSQRLFISDRGRDISPNWIQKLFRKASEYININASPHILRHTFGTYHFLLNQDIEGLATLMGHEESATTKKYYVGLATNISYAGTYSGLQEKIDKQIEDALNE